METTVSGFPIIIQHRPGSRRHHDSSTFVRAHVMERYHRKRKQVSKTDVTKALTHKEGIEARTDIRVSEAAQLKHPGAEVDSSSKTVAPDFIEYLVPAIPNHKVRKRVNSRRDALGIDKQIAPAKVEPASMQRLRMTLRINRLRLNDPREQESSKFMLVFNSYCHLLENRQISLDQLSRNWLPVAFTDLALFHAILFNFSQHMYALCSIDHEKPSLLTHKVGALREISTRIANPVEAYTDPIIASILCLVSHELLNRDTEAIQSHIRGLRHIIIAREGVDELGLGGTLRAVYLSYELLLATIFQSWTTNLPPPSLISYHNCSGKVPMARSNIFTLCRKSVNTYTKDFNIEAIYMLSALEDLFESPGAYIKPNLYRDLQMFFQSLPKILRSDMKPKSKDEIPTSNYHILASLHLAVALHLSIMRATPSIRLIEKLKLHLTESFTGSFWEQFPGAFIWCCVVGVVVSKGQADRPWFVANLIRLTTGLAFEKLDALKESLYSFSKLGLVD